MLFVDIVLLSVDIRAHNGVLSSNYSVTLGSNNCATFVSFFMLNIVDVIILLMKTEYVILYVQDYYTAFYLRGMNWKKTFLLVVTGFIKLSDRDYRCFKI